MSTKMTLRIAISLTLAIAFGLGGAVAATQAQESTQQPITDDCQGCHEITRETWQAGQHGQAASNLAFQTAWQEQGQPSECMACHATGYDQNSGTWRMEGVACTVCHTPANQEHPLGIMPTDISSRKCGECHLDTYADWELSTHAKEELTCVRCHNSHTTTIKADDVQTLCQSCHNETAHFFTYSPHAEAGLMCADCHLSVTHAEMGDGHAQRRHTFEVRLDTCAECHGEGLHAPIASVAGVDQAEAVQAGILPIMDEHMAVEPNQVNPLGFAIIGTLVGVAAGMVMAPWLERWYKQMWP